MSEVLSQPQVAEQPSVTQPIVPAVPQVHPQKIDRLSEGVKSWQYTDKNGYKWEYQFQFPGIREAYAILDYSKDANGNLMQGDYMDQLITGLVVEPVNLSLDDFNERPGLNELIEVLDTFLGERIN